MKRTLRTILACSLVAFGLTRAVSAAQINVLLSTNGGVADINGSATGGFGSVAANLNDGNTDGNFGDGSVAHSTSNPAGNFMEVTTPSLDSITSVSVYNRLGFESRLDDGGLTPYTLTIYKGTPVPANIVFTENLTYTANLTGANFTGQLITLPSAVVGNVVRITQNNADFMNLAELEALGQHVPEPSSFILCGIAAIGLFAAARRRLKA